MDEQPGAEGSDGIDFEDGAAFERQSPDLHANRFPHQWAERMGETPRSTEETGAEGEEEGPDRDAEEAKRRIDGREDDPSRGQEEEQKPSCSRRHGSSEGGGTARRPA